MSKRIFEDRTPMPERYECVATAMVREDTHRDPGSPVPRMSGELHWPDRDISHVYRPRRGHGY